MARPSPETRLALANLGAITRGRVLIVGFGPELAASLQGATVFHQDLRAHRATPGSLFGPWFSSTERFDTVVVELPPAAERLRMLLAMARAAMVAGGRLVLVGRNDAGIRRAASDLQAMIGGPRLLGFRFHCRAFTATLEREPAPAPLADWRSEFDAAGARAVSYPGVFSHGRLDDGTRMLLGALQVPEGARALDLGCGSGAVGAWLRSRGVAVDCVDVDALAVAATEETIALNPGAPARAFASDLFSDVTERYTHVVTNPPFHRGARATLGITVPLIREAPSHLEPGGELWLVANRQLHYLPHLRAAFASVEAVREDRRFRVWRATRA